MRKTYIIKDAREMLAEQIKNNGLIERDVTVSYTHLTLPTKA